ncbi:MAG: ABC transporter permease [Pseudomonadales bacterium]|nr:ABC transporter permease [Pseudomonadales bacterium]
MTTPRRALVAVDIRPLSSHLTPDWAELWAYRDLLWMFAVRDVQVRYKQTLFGVAWAIVQPVMMMVVMTLIFGKGLGLEDTYIPGVPYAVGYLAAQIVWSFFAAALTSSANSLVANAAIVRKAYFPRLLLPLAATSTAMVDFAVAFVVYLVVTVTMGVVPDSRLLLLPLVLIGTAITTLGLGLWLSALMVTYRDVRFVVPYCVQVGFFVTPVIWWEQPLATRLDPWGVLLYLNPISGPLTTFRDIMTGQPIDWAGWAVSTSVGVAVLVFGLRYFVRTEALFADVA